MKKGFIIIVATIFLVQCGKPSTGTISQTNAQIQIWAKVVKVQNGLAKSAKTTATIWDSLVIRISSADADMDTLRKAAKFGAGDSSVNCALSDVPAGKARIIEVWTKTIGGLVIHSCASKKVDIAAGEIKYVEFELMPKRGSIYINCADIPSSIDRLCASFIFNATSDTLTVSEKRSSKTYLSIDNVPDSAAGTLGIVGLGIAGDTLYKSSMPLVFYSNQNKTYSAVVSKVNTGLSLDVAAGAPAATIISASLGNKKPFETELGPLIISEIMYSANDSEYIEVYNSLAKDTVFDTLILDIDGAYRFFSNVSVKSNGFFVFGRKPLPWVNAVPSVASALDLSSSGGNWITIRAKDSTAMDWVAFQGGSNTQGWPNAGVTKKSIVLDSLVKDPSYNNYGTHWVLAKTPINQVDPKYNLPITMQWGTPGVWGQ